jgi:hypothetical protein
MSSSCALYNLPGNAIFSQEIHDALITYKYLPEVVKLIIVRPDESMATEQSCMG